MTISTISRVHQASRRLQELPKNEFRRLTELKAELRTDGKKIIDLSEGLPDLPPNDRFLAFIGRMAEKPELYRYPTRWGMDGLITQIEQFLCKRYSVARGNWAILPVAGSKEAFAHIAQAVLNPGEQMMAPSPGYPIYEVAASYAGAKTVRYCIDEDGSPLMPSVSKSVLEQVGLMFMTSPNNPTGKVVPREGVLETLSFCDAHDVVLCQDMAYANLTSPSHPATSLLSVARADQLVVEVHSLSKSLSIPGMRFGFVAGNRTIIQNLEVSKAVFDTGLFPVVQKAARYALVNFEEFNEAPLQIYRHRLQRSAKLLAAHGIQVAAGTAGLFQWVEVNAKKGSGTRFSEQLLNEHSILVLPGCAFSDTDDTHIRISLTVNNEIIDQVLPIIGRLLSQFRLKT